MPLFHDCGFTADPTRKNVITNVKRQRKVAFFWNSRGISETASYTRVSGVLYTVHLFTNPACSSSDIFLFTQRIA
jgi:hypothetical protein